MSEEKKKRLRGFARIVSKQVEPLKENAKFKERFKDTEVKILLNAKDGKYAALLVIDKGTIHVEGFKNNPKKNLRINLKPKAIAEIVAAFPQVVSFNKRITMVLRAAIQTSPIHKIIVPAWYDKLGNQVSENTVT